MSKRNGQQKGPQQHAEGQHGSKTHSAFIDDLHGKHGGGLESEGKPQEKMPEAGEPHEGGHRLAEERQQHDEAEKNSEKNRLVRERKGDDEPVEGDSVNGRLHS